MRSRLASGAAGTLSVSWQVVGRPTANMCKGSCGEVCSRQGPNEIALDPALDAHHIRRRRIPRIAADKPICELGARGLAQQGLVVLILAQNGTPLGLAILGV